MDRKIYLSMKSVDEAKTLFFSQIAFNQRTGVETIKTEEALDRVTAEPIFAKRSTPSFHSAAMDGIAVRAEQTYGTTEREPRTLKIGEDALWINTGQPLPESFNAVIMAEKIHEKDDTHLEIRSSAYPWQHVRKVGEDIVATQLLLPQNHKIRPYDIGAIMGAGVFSINVWEKPRVAIIPTGSELVHYKDIKENEPLEQNKIIEYNSMVLAGLIRKCNAIPILYDIIPDIEARIHETLKKAIASNAHLVIINAGSSAGSKDYTAAMIEAMGAVLVHGVAMMPGKPTILGVVKGKPVVGNPGYAVSSMLSFEQFVKPLLYRLQGQHVPQPKTVPVKLSRDVPSRLGIEEFLRVHIGKVGPGYIATPLPRAAGAISTLTRAEGIVRIPALSEGVSQNEEVEAELLVEEEALLNTVVVIGSHDISIDILADEIGRGAHNIRVSSGNVGSLGGLIALKKGTCHMAGSHLLDPETGQYNLSYIRKYLKGMPVHVFHLVLRDQGLIVAKGNPKGIEEIKDLADSDTHFVNRQAGSGTRVLFDYKLAEAGIPRESIKGYDHEEFTHMAVAVDVLSGAADCGMGIFAAAKALKLDFVPVVREQYDLIIPSAMVDQPNIQVVLETIRSASFRDRVNALGGYDPSKSGELWTALEGGENGIH
jgi:putative molybdopterin biosynthesis protein